MASLKKKKFGLGAVSLVVGRLPRYDLAVMKEVDIEIESLLNNIGFFSDAPFERASLVFRYAERENPSVKIGSIDTKYHDLPLTIQLSFFQVKASSRDELKHLFTKASLKALIEAGRQYGCPVAELESLLKQIDTSI